MLEVDHASLGYGAQTVVHDVTLRLQPGEIGCLLGPSGCGKTTLLRAIAGFEPLRDGNIRLAGQPVAGANLHRPPRERGVGMVFQDYALFPHLDVAGNVAFGLRGLAAAERQRRVEELLALVGLLGLQARWPHELSGGQQQRVALARALAPRPTLLLMDEPFSNLDASLRESIAREVRAILRQAGATALMVTHDQLEAFAMADRIGVMTAGHLRQWDDAFEIYRHPATREVAALVGEGALLPAQRAPDGLWTTAAGTVAANTPHFDNGAHVEVLLRPQALRLDDSGPVQGTVTERVFRGSHFLYTVELASEARVLVHGHIDRPRDTGTRVGLRMAHPDAATE